MGTVVELWEDNFKKYSLLVFSSETVSILCTAQGKYNQNVKQ